MNMLTPHVIPADRPRHRPAANETDASYAHELTPAQRHAATRCGSINPSAPPKP